ncbi:TRAP transporter small permease [Uliginosibacterium sp. sgz301328]|uniref:TRAP transporter small permease n=1 Tax=Uliginosibacterium sp. sgz301328 TaxID=3243764 RepID=UPI00359DCA84
MDRLIAGYCRLLNAVSAIFLAIMVVLVFGNVVLRYAFNSGISTSDEVSRWLFVWVTFLGATAALRDHAHLGTDVLVGRLPRGGKKFCLFVGHLLMLYVSWLLFQGSLQQARINWDVSAPTTGASVAIFYASGVVFAVSAAIILVLDLIKLMTNRLSDEQLVMVQESEEVPPTASHGSGDAPVVFASHGKA